MVMADFLDNDRGRRGRRRGMGRRGADRGGTVYRDRGRYQDDSYSYQQPPKKILSKPFEETSTDDVPSKVNYRNSHTHNSHSNKSARNENSNRSASNSKTTDDKKTKDFNSALENNSNNIPTLLANDTMPAQVYKEKKSRASTSEGRLTAPAEMRSPLKLIDETLCWSETGANVLLDQTDFLVVGVLGLQGVGKSTVLSMLAGGINPITSRVTNVFKSQARDMRDLCSHQTVGVDFLVTSERTILLDSQALLSSSVLDCMIHRVDYDSVENVNELQSLKVASFLMSVCNVVVVVLDWFADLSLLKTLLSAEMLKPTSSSASSESKSESSAYESFPHIVFVLNNATSDDFNCEKYFEMQQTLQSLFANSKLKISTGLSMRDLELMAAKRGKPEASRVNLVLLPKMPRDERLQKGKNNAKPEKPEPKNAKEAIFSLMPEFRGHPSFKCVGERMRRQMLMIPRHQLAHTVLSEKTWFHFAALCWENVRKSTLFSEYTRLLP